MDTKNFVQDGKEYTFIGNKDIICGCLSNGQKCNQRNMENISENPWTTGDWRQGYICNRVWKEVM
jgi:hypothetical protein